MSEQEYQDGVQSEFAREMEKLLALHDYERPKVGDIRQAIIVSLTSQGVIVDLGLKRDGIVPPSDLEKLDAEERAALSVNDEVAVFVTGSEEDSLSVSLHKARLNEDWIRARELMDAGEIIEVEISDHNRGGALAPFGRIRGFIPASHLGFLHAGMDDRQRQERMVEAHGETIAVKVIEVDRQRRRLVLSQREAEREWQDKRRRELMQTLQVGDVIQGRISGWRDFGAFVDLGGADGLIHISELAWQRVNHPQEVVSMGQEIDVYVLKVDRERERISLSRKRLRPNPWSQVEETYYVGQLVEGRVIRIVDYGAFVEVEPGIEGLLHTSQMAQEHVSDPHSLLQENETHLLRVISIDANRQRMGLSLKAVTPTEQIEWMTSRQEQIVETEKEAADPVTEASEILGAAVTSEVEGGKGNRLAA